MVCACVSFSHVHVCFQVTAKMVANAWHILAELLLNKLEEYGHRRLGHGSQAVLLKGPVLSHRINHSPEKMRQRERTKKKKKAEETKKKAGETEQATAV